MVPAGAVAEAQGRSVWYLGVLIVCSAFGRIAGASILYWIADRFEDKLLSGGRRFLGVSHRDVERFGQRLGRAGKRDWVLLFLVNGIPIFPGAVTSLACGFIKVRFRMFALCTFFGTMVNALIYLALGYTGFKVAEALRGIEIGTQVVAVLLIVTILVWYWRKKHSKAA